ncbi:MAG: hypothetical protein JWN64_324 [Parcubacteria group bacterium]|nr:hypothetical protein [Parcubacteria group bacterium]
MRDGGQVHIGVMAGDVAARAAGVADAVADTGHGGAVVGRRLGMHPVAAGHCGVARRRQTRHRRYRADEMEPFHGSSPSRFVPSLLKARASSSR